jgi:hypothetical protein
MTQQLGDGRIAYLQARSAHDAEPSLSAEQAEDVSGALAKAAATGRVQAVRGGPPTSVVQKSTLKAN